MLIYIHILHFEPPECELKYLMGSSENSYFKLATYCHNIRRINHDFRRSLLKLMPALASNTSFAFDDLLI